MANKECCENCKETEREIEELARLLNTMTGNSPGLKAYRLYNKGYRRVVEDVDIGMDLSPEELSEHTLDKGERKMKGLKCEKCAFFDELESEQPCCACEDFTNFVEIDKAEQIEEMTKILKEYTKKRNIMASHVILEAYAEELYNAGFCKQKEKNENS